MTLHQLPSHIETDPEGFLLHLGDWDKSIADCLAHQESISLSSDHWEVIDYVRRFYEEFQTSPAIRPLVNYLKQCLGPEKGNSIYLHTLFPESPAKQAAKIAGLPKPKRCI